jgi:NAD(P)-dependent dehydrogenase (short-subunit alcohol dehydrogenase family)
MDEKTKRSGLAGTTAVVTGAGRGFGRGIAVALAGAGVHVVGLGRTQAHLDEVRDELGDSFTAIAADAADPATAVRVVDQYLPRILVLGAWAAPRMSPLHEQTWESFSQNWNVDVAQAFHWVRAALRRPLPPGSSVIAFSSGAAINGSPLSGGYAGAKATVKLIADYAAIESKRAALRIGFVSVLPRLSPATDLGAAAVAAYAARQGVSVEDFVQNSGPVLDAEQVGKAILELATGEQHQHNAFLLTAAGLAPVA